MFIVGWAYRMNWRNEKLMQYIDPEKKSEEVERWEELEVDRRIILKLLLMRLNRIMVLDAFNLTHSI
jgi:hypothetical protein